MQFRKNWFLEITKKRTFSTTLFQQNRILVLVSQILTE
jgi:hypothetical protein